MVGIKSLSVIQGNNSSSLIINLYIFYNIINKSYDSRYVSYFHIPYLIVENNTFDNILKSWCKWFR